jgi:hypothetical protein
MLKNKGVNIIMFSKKISDTGANLTTAEFKTMDNNGVALGQRVFIDRGKYLCFQNALCYSNCL